MTTRFCHTRTTIVLAQKGSLRVSYSVALLMKYYLWQIFIYSSRLEWFLNNYIFILKKVNFARYHSYKESLATFLNRDANSQCYIIISYFFRVQLHTHSTDDVWFRHSLLQLLCFLAYWSLIIDITFLH